MSPLYAEVVRFMELTVLQGRIEERLVVMTLQPSGRRRPDLISTPVRAGGTELNVKACRVTAKRNAASRAAVNAHPVRPRDGMGLRKGTRLG